ALVYAYGWSMAIWVSGSIVTALVGLAIVGKRINRLARQTGALTLVDLLRDRFNSQSIGVVYAIIIVIVTTVYLIAQFVAGARILQAILGIDYLWGLGLFAISVVAYTTYGGFRAVAWTDTLQGIVMIIGVVLLVPFAIHAVGGLERATLDMTERQDPVAVAQGVETAKHAYLYGPGPAKIPKDLNDVPAGVPLEPWLPLSMGLSMFVLRSLGAVMSPTAVPRMLAFRDTHALRRALIVLAPYLLLMYGSSLITMNCAFSLDLGLPAGQYDQAVPRMAQAVAPRWLAGLLIAAPFAAVMSTVDSALLVISASIVRDLIQRSAGARLETSTTKKLSYFVTAGTGAIAFGLAVQPPPFLQPLVIYYVGGSVSTLFWPGLATFYWKRATASGVLSGLIGGALAYGLANQWPPLVESIPLHPVVYGLLTSGLLVLCVSLATTPQDDRTLARYFGRPPK
ncbi:MAG: sodium/solute symporter, partial [Pirellulaceae bacterium]|nr:sodium/solute symporter [Pirellulaceae bacterium]